MDKDLLTQLGLTKHQMENCDALFFFQLLLPICNPQFSGVEGDPRMAFYSDVEVFSLMYAYQIGLGGSYGHSFKTLSLDELVRFDGVLVQDGVRGGSQGGIHRRWKDGADFDKYVKHSMTFTRWLQIKRVIKLCDNNTSPKRGEDGYDPTYKYNLIYKVLIANVNALTEKGEMDLCGDETSWGHQGYGKVGSGVVARVVGKPGVSKGGQTVIVSDINRCRPRAYMHRHKLHN